MIWVFFSRYYVIYRLPKLKFLDSTAVQEIERKEARRAGAFMRVVSTDKVKLMVVMKY